MLSTGDTIQNYFELNGKVWGLPQGGARATRTYTRLVLIAALTATASSKHCKESVASQHSNKVGSVMNMLNKRNIRDFRGHP